MPGQPVFERVIVYIDGFNLYLGIRASGLGRYLWLDLCAFAKNLLHPGQNLVSVRYFTSRVSAPESKRKRQSAYLDALSTLDPLMVFIAYGNFQLTPFRCHQCGGESDVPNEKQTDVNIAVEMLADAFLDRFDVALLVSADSDLCPAVSAVRKLFPNKRIVACFPPGRASKELASVVSASYTIGRGKLKDSQFPDVIETAGGFRLHKPASWDDPEYQKPH
jgi:uncharacterized LabA/DUF88 family protein